MWPHNSVRPFVRHCTAINITAKKKKLEWREHIDVERMQKDARIWVNEGVKKKDKQQREWQDTDCMWGHVVARDEQYDVPLQNKTTTHWQPAQMKAQKAASFVNRWQLSADTLWQRSAGDVSGCALCDRLFLSQRYAACLLCQGLWAN